MLHRSIARAVLLGLALLAALPPAGPAGAAPGGPKYHDCRGYLREVTGVFLRVQCNGGVPAGLIFVTYPTYANKANGKNVKVRDLAPGTALHVVFTESLGIRHAYKIFVADPHGRGPYGFQS